MKLAYIDFEYQPTHLNIELVCAVVQLNTETHPRKYWLFNDEDAHIALHHALFDLIKDGFVFVVFYLPAEAGCFSKLRISAEAHRWLDCHVIGMPFYHSSYHFMRYSNEHAAVEDEEVFLNEESLDEFSFEDEKSKVAKRKSNSLLSFYEFFCQQNIQELDASKDANRDLILSLSKNHAPSDITKEKILNYCELDVSILRLLLEGQFKKWTEVTGKNNRQLMSQFLNWTKFRLQMWHTSKRGVPLEPKLYEKYCKEHDQLVLQEQQALPQFYRFDPPKGKKSGKYVDCRKKFEEVVRKHELQYNWPRTPSKQYSRDERVLLDYQIHDDFAKYLAAKKRIKQIQFFKPDKTGTPKISKYVDFDGDIYWQHPDFGTFGTTTGRNAHRTESFIMGMERSLRAKLLGCPAEMELVVADYSAQEVWIAGALSGDENQLKASKIDPYMDFGINIGLMPSDATKHSHGAIRDVCKSVVLAAFYGMGIQSLSRKIGRPESETKHIYTANRQYYAKFFDWQKEYLTQHKRTRYYELPDGWCLFDNCNWEGEYKTPPAMNFPIQGMGAAIMRKVVDLFYQHDLKLIYTLHDEFAVLCYKNDKDKVTKLITELMQAACTYYFPQYEPPRVGFK